MRKDARDLHPAVYRIVWLIIFLGALAMLGAGLLLVFGPSISLPSNVALPAVGGLFFMGLFWLIIGLIVLWWLRASVSAPSSSSDLSERPVRDEALSQRINQLEAGLAVHETSLAALAARINEFEKVGQTLRTRDGQPARPASPASELDKELNNLATAIQDVNKRLDSIADAAHKVSDLESQLDELYVTLHDVHKRIDDLENTYKS